MTDRSSDITAAADLAFAGEALVSDYVALLKPRVMSLVVFTGLVGLVLAPGEIHPVLGVVAIMCIAVAAGAAGAINMWYDRDIDALMSRTRERPVPAGRMAPGEALGFGVVLAVGSVTIMALAINWAAAALLALTIGFYVFVYTVWLKRRTPQNIVIGGAAGAFPPMVGWAAVTGDVALGSIALIAIIFMWTPPHFWALALYRQGDYKRAGVPMLPVVSGDRETRKQILLYSILLMPVSLAPWALEISGMIHAVTAVTLGAVFLGLAVLVRVNDAERHARALFAFSIFYLFGLFAALLADGLIGQTV